MVTRRERRKSPAALVLVCSGGSPRQPSAVAPLRERGGPAGEKGGQVSRPRLVGRQLANVYAENGVLLVVQEPVEVGQLDLGELNTWEKCLQRPGRPIDGRPGHWRPACRWRG